MNKAEKVEVFNRAQQPFDTLFVAAAEAAKAVRANPRAALPVAAIAALVRYQAFRFNGTWDLTELEAAWEWLKSVGVMPEPGQGPTPRSTLREAEMTIDPKRYRDLVKEVRWTLRWGSLTNNRPRMRRPVQALYLVGSQARGTATPDSDVAVAVVIEPVRGKTALQYSEQYHAGQRALPLWQGLRLDLQFFYPGEVEELGYTTAKLA